MARGRGDDGPRVPGIVLEVTGRTAVVLSEGRFLRVPAIPGWESGEEIWVAAGPTAPWRQHLRRRLSVALVGCVAVASGGVLWAGVASAQVAAVVSVDINPSVQLEVDAQGDVVRATAMDADAQRLLNEGALTSMPLQQAVGTVVDRAVSDGYLTASQDGTAPPVILVAAAPAHANAPALPPPVADAVNQAQAQVQTVLRNKDLQATVAVTQAPHSDVRAARSAKLSVGRYEMYSDVKAAGTDTEPSQWQNQTLDQALTRSGVPRSLVPDVVSAVAQHADAAKVIEGAQHGESAAALEGLIHAAQASAGASGFAPGNSAADGAASSSHHGGQDEHGDPGQHGDQGQAGDQGAGHSQHGDQSQHGEQGQQTGQGSHGDQGQSGDQTQHGGQVNDASGDHAGVASTTGQPGTLPASAPGDGTRVPTPTPSLLQRLQQEIFGSHSRRGRNAGDGGGDQPSGGSRAPARGGHDAEGGPSGGDHSGGQGGGAPGHTQRHGNGE